MSKVAKEIHYFNIQIFMNVVSSHIYIFSVKSRWNSFRISNRNRTQTMHRSVRLFVLMKKVKINQSN